MSLRAQAPSYRPAQGRGRSNGRPRVQAAKPKPLSQQAKAGMAKETISKTHTLPIAIADATMKGNLADNDVRHHLSNAELQKILYQAVTALAGMHGKAIFTQGATVSSGTVTLTVKVKLNSDNCLKMFSAITNKAAINGENAAETYSETPPAPEEETYDST